MAAVLATLAASCVGTGDRTWGSQNVALQLVDGQPTLLLYTCPGSKAVTSVTVVKHDIHANVDKILWQVSRASATSTAAAPVETMTIGKPAPDYRTVTPLQGTLPATSLDVTLTRDHLEGIVNFKTSQLKAAVLLVDRTWFDGKRWVDLDTFMLVNRMNC